MAEQEGMTPEEADAWAEEQLELDEDHPAIELLQREIKSLKRKLAHGEGVENLIRRCVAEHYKRPPDLILPTFFHQPDLCIPTSFQGAQRLGGCPPRRPGAIGREKSFTRLRGPAERDRFEHLSGRKMPR